jgi:hypothetical protein
MRWLVHENAMAEIVFPVPVESSTESRMIPAEITQVLK